MSGKFRPARMVQRSGRCLGRELGEIVEAVKMPPTRNGTKRPREPSLQLSAGVGRTVRRIGGRLRGGDPGPRGADLEIPPSVRLAPNMRVHGHRLAGSLTGVVASKRVTEASKGPLSTVGNRASSAMAEGGSTARQTSRTGAKAGHSDPAVPYGRAVAQRIKGTPGITG